MAKQRRINTKFWSDNFIRNNLGPLQRYLFLYFLTNEKTNIAGIYELSLDTIIFETGIQKKELLKYLENLKPKIEYIDGWVYIANFQKHQNTGSNDVIKGIEREMQFIPSNIRQYIDGLGTVPTQSDTIPRQPDIPIPILTPILTPKLTPTPNGDFEKFWDLYNKKVGDKNACEKKWNSLKQEEKEKILNSLPARKNQFSDIQYQPFPETYLNQKRWNDEIKQTKKAFIL